MARHRLAAVGIGAALVALVAWGTCGRGGGGDLAQDDRTRMEGPLPQAPAVASHAETSDERVKRTRRATDAPTLRIDGIVQDFETDAPIADAAVEVFPSHPRQGVPFEEPSGAPETSGRSDAEGRFAVDVPDAEPRVVVARAPGHLDEVATSRGGLGECVLRLRSGEPHEFVVRSVPGTPIAGAEVVVEFDDQGFRPRRARSDDDGRVRVVAPGSGELLVRAESYASASIRFGARRSLPDVVVLRRPQPIAGVVVDATRRPVAGAMVKGATPGKRYQIVTGDDGRFAFDDVDPEEFSVQLLASRDGFVAAEGLTVHPGDLDVRIVLSRPCSVEGVVVLPDGRAPAEGEFGGVSFWEGGAFHVEKLSPGERAFEVWAREGDAFFDGLCTVQLADGEDVHGLRVEVHRRQGSFVVVRLVGPGGAAIDHTRLRSGSNSQRSGVSSIPPVPGREDRVVVPFNEPPGYDGEVGLSGIRCGEIDYPEVTLSVVTAPSPEVAPVVVTLPTLDEFAVDILDAPPLPWQPGISLRPSVERPQVVSPHFTRREGSRFVWVVPVNVPYRIVAEAAGCARLDRPVTDAERVAGHATIRMSSGATVRVHVTARPPARLATPWFVLAPLDAAHPHMTPLGEAADGKFAIERVPAGRWEARIGACGGVAQKRLTIDVPATGDVDLGDVEVPGETLLEGRVITSDGRPAGGAALEFFFAEWVMAPRDGIDALTRTDGTFSMNVPVGTGGDLLVSKDGSGAVIVAIDGKSPWIDVKLGVECGLRVEVGGRRGESVSAVVLRPGGLAEWGPRGDVLEHGAGGSTCVYHGLAPGKWIVRRNGDDDAPVVQREVTLVAGETAEVTLEAPK